MPVMDGLEFVPEAVKVESAKGIPIVMITTEGGQAKVMEAVQLGAAGYVRKRVRAPTNAAPFPATTPAGAASRRTARPSTSRRRGTSCQSETGAFFRGPACLKHPTGRRKQPASVSPGSTDAEAVTMPPCGMSFG